MDQSVIEIGVGITFLFMAFVCIGTNLWVAHRAKWNHMNDEPLVLGVLLMLSLGTYFPVLALGGIALVWTKHFPEDPFVLYAILGSCIAFIGSYCLVWQEKIRLPRIRFPRPTLLLV